MKDSNGANRKGSPMITSSHHKRNIKQSSTQVYSEAHYKRVRCIEGGRYYDVSLV